MAGRAIRINAGDVSATAALDGSRTADAIWQALPVDARGSTWGDEIRPASAVNVFGKVDGDPTLFKNVRAGARVKLERLDARG